MGALPIRCDSVAVVVLRDNGDTLLLLRTDAPVSWSQPAGEIAPEQTAQDTAVRVLQAQTGLKATALYTADWHEAFYDPAREQLSIVPVFVAQVGAADRVVLDQAHSDYRWLPVPDAMNLVSFSGQRAMFRHVAAEFLDRQPSALQRLA